MQLMCVFSHEKCDRVSFRPLDRETRFHCHHSPSQFRQFVSILATHTFLKFPGSFATFLQFFISFNLEVIYARLQGFTEFQDFLLFSRILELTHEIIFTVYST